MRRVIILSLLLFACSYAFGQAKKFDKKFGYFEYELTPSLQIVDSQNNHIVVGMFKGFHKVGNTTIQTKGDFDVFVIKYDANNSIVWVKTFGSSAEDNVNSVSCDKFGNIYFTGFYSGNAFYTSTTDSLNYITGYSQSRYITKLNANGNAVWSKRFSATNVSGDPTKSEVINDHDGRVYLVVTNRANGALNTWQYQDSTIANPSFANINVPRWLLTRLDENSGKIKWLDYISNPLIAGNFISILNISRPVVDKNNHLVFAISHFGNYITPIYVFGQYAATSVSNNNILVRIDSVGTVRNFRDLGTATNAWSDITDIAINNNNEVFLINKKAKATDNGITYDYTSNANTYNYARIYDENFTLTKIVKLGQQNIRSYVFDKQNRLVTLGTSSVANFNQTPVDEVLNVDSTSKTVSFNTNGTILPYIFRYSETFKLDTFYLENRLNPLMQLSAATNSLRIAKNGDIIPTVGYPAMNMTMFRYDSTLRSKNTLLGKHRDREDMILGMVEDTAGQIYTAGVFHGLAYFNSLASASDSLKIPFESGQDNFIAKYNKDGNIIWIKKITTQANDIISQLTISKSGIYFVVSNPSYSSWNYNDSVTVSGIQVLMKVDFNGNLIWSKQIYTTVNPNNAPTRPSLNLIKSLNNDNVLIGIYAFNTVYLGSTLLPTLGNRTGQIYAVLNGNNGDIVRYNRFALRDESFSQIGSPLSNAYEDKKGNLYLALTSSYTNVNSNLTANELYSLRTNAIAFSHIWVSQPGILKLDSLLEMSKFYQFTSYMYLGDITGLGDNIYITGRSRNNSMTYNSTVIPTHSYAQNAHFVSFFARLDTALNITKVTKFDTTSIEYQFDLYNRRILVDPSTKNIYETLQFKGTTGIDGVSYKTTSFGGTDLMFVKHDSAGNVIGGQHMGTPQSDYYSSALINKSSSLIFTSRSVDPNFSNKILSPRLVASPGVTQPQILPVVQNKITTNSSSLVTVANSTAEDNVEINKEILSPDTYLSKYISLNELGNVPDTTILSVSKNSFCQGDSAIIEVNDATRIRWKRDQQFISSEGAKIGINASGVYKAFIYNVEGIVDSTRSITINVTPSPAAPTVSNASYCIGVTTGQLSATANSTNTLLWYGTAATAGTFTTSSIAPSSSTAGQTTFYVSQKTIENSCEGPRAGITVTIHPKPNNPTVNNINTCVGLTPIALTASVTSGNALKWYGTSANAGTATSTAPLPSTASTGTFDYYVSQASTTTGCESDRSKITLVVNSTPAKPTVSDVTYCVGATTSTLSATAITGNELKWYGLSASGGTASNSAPTPSSSNAGTFEYYVSQAATNTGCESERSKITMLVNPTPSKPTVSNINSCIGSPEISLTVAAGVGNELKWYGTSASGGTATNTAPKHSTTSIGNFDYYVSQSSTTSGCESERSKITLSVYGIPSAPEIKRDIENYLVSSYNTGNLWYRDGVSIADTSLKFKPTIPGKYSVRTTQNGCNSVQSNAYYYLITDIMNLSDFEFIKLVPNPFINKLNLDFVIKDIQKLNMDVFEISTGNKVASLTGLVSGGQVNLGYLSAGTYYIKISTVDNKMNYQFKMIKL